MFAKKRKKNRHNVAYQTSKKNKQNNPQNSNISTAIEDSNM